MMDIAKLSSRYQVRSLDATDLDDIVELCRHNTVFYQYTDARPTRAHIRDDMRATPPGIDPSAKYYFGFFDDQALVAVMDLVDGYPKADIAYIGFFMMNVKRQGKQAGTAIIREVIHYLSSIGKTAVRLAIDKDNPQSTHFWRKNGFEIITEVNINGWTKLVAEKALIV